MPILNGQLLHSPANVIAQALIDIGLASEVSSVGAIGGDWPVTVDTELNLPDDSITVTNTQGELNGRIQITGEQPEHFGFQIKVRASLPTTGWQKANGLAVALDQSLSHQSVTIDSSIYAVGAVTRKGGVLAIGRELASTKRFLYTINAVVVINQTV